MLANESGNVTQVGSLNPEVHRPATFRHELVEFIANELPKWKSRPDRPIVAAETALTSQLCAHLNSASRHADGWDVLQFRVEEPDELKGGRKIDLVAAPSGTTIVIEGRRHIDFESLMPLECKRLPTPQGADRDEREYVISRFSSTGGIHRFKTGQHGGAHRLGAMIGYVQGETRDYWRRQVKRWIEELAKSGSSGWSTGDLLELLEDDNLRGLSKLRSSHTRVAGMDDFELRHLWVSMN
jgi:hypothetical protein